MKEARNDLEEPACQLVPQIEDARDALRRAGALFARMSGSGATCFGVFSTRPEADQAAALLEERHPDWFVLATETRSPVPTQAEHDHVHYARA